MVLKFANTGLWKDTGGLLLLICLLLAVGSLQLAPAEGVMCLYAVSHNILRVMSQQCRFSQWMASPGTSSCQSSGTWVASSKEQYLPKDSSSNTPHVSHEARHLPMGDSLALPLKCLLSKFWNTTTFSIPENSFLVGVTFVAPPCWWLIWAPQRMSFQWIHTAPQQAFTSHSKTRLCSQKQGSALVGGVFQN